MRAVVETQWSVVSPTSATVSTPGLAQPRLEVGADEGAVDVLGDDRLPLVRLGLGLELEGRGCRG